MTEIRRDKSVFQKTVVCLGCGVPKLKIRDPRSNGKDAWKDKDGYLWNGNSCRDCQLVIKTRRRRKRGIKERDQVLEPRVVKARDAEKRVAEWFRGLAFEVDLTTGEGPDLICKAGSVSLCVEVKSCVASKVDDRIFWLVGKVTANRIHDHLVAIVFPSGRIHLEQMENHLKKCNSVGIRSVTRLVREDFLLGE